MVVKKISELTEDEIKKELSKRGMDISGNKPELFARLRKILVEEAMRKRAQMTGATANLMEGQSPVEKTNQEPKAVLESPQPSSEVSTPKTQETMATLGKFTPKTSEAKPSVEESKPMVSEPLATTHAVKAQELKPVQEQLAINKDIKPPEVNKTATAVVDVIKTDKNSCEITKTTNKIIEEKIQIPPTDNLVKASPKLEIIKPLVVKVDPVVGTQKANSLQKKVVETSQAIQKSPLNTPLVRKSTRSSALVLEPIKKVEEGVCIMPGGVQRSVSPAKSIVNLASGEPNVTTVLNDVKSSKNNPKSTGKLKEVLNSDTELIQSTISPDKKSTESLNLNKNLVLDSSIVAVNLQKAIDPAKVTVNIADVPITANPLVTLEKSLSPSKANLELSGINENSKLTDEAMVEESIKKPVVVTKSTKKEAFVPPPKQAVTTRSKAILKESIKSLTSDVDKSKEKLIINAPICDDIALVKPIDIEPINHPEISDLKEDNASDNLELANEAPIFECFDESYGAFINEENDISQANDRFETEDQERGVGNMYDTVQKSNVDLGMPNTEDVDRQDVTWRTQNQTGTKDNINDDKISLWITGLPKAVKANDLRSKFSPHGKIISAKIVTSAKNPGSKCFGYVIVEDKNIAQNIIDKFNHTETFGSLITVDFDSKRKLSTTTKLVSNKLETSTEPKAVPQSNLKAVITVPKIIVKSSDIKPKIDNKDISKDTTEETKPSLPQEEGKEEGGESKSIEDAPKKIPVKNIVPPVNSFWVLGFAGTTSATDLKQLCLKFGKVISAKVILTGANKTTTKYYGLITMTLEEEVNKCVRNISGIWHKGYKLSVRKHPANMSVVDFLGNKGTNEETVKKTATESSSKPSVIQKEPVKTNVRGRGISRPFSSRGHFNRGRGMATANRGHVTSTRGQLTGSRMGHGASRGEQYDHNNGNGYGRFNSRPTRGRFQQGRFQLNQELNNPSVSVMNLMGNLKQGFPKENIFNRADNDLQLMQATQQNLLLEEKRRHDQTRIAYQREQLELEKLKLEREKIEAERVRIQMMREREEWNLEESGRMVQKRSLEDSEYYAPISKRRGNLPDELNYFAGSSSYNDDHEMGVTGNLGHNSRRMSNEVWRAPNNFSASYNKNNNQFPSQQRIDRYGNRW